MGQRTFIQQSNFSAGSISPKLQSQGTTATYKNGLATAENVQLEPQGNFSKRIGSVQAGKCNTTNLGVRLVPFIINENETVMIEFGNLYACFYYQGKQVLSGGALYVVTTTFTSDQIATMTYNQYYNTLYMAHINHAPCTLVFNSSLTNWTFGTFSLATVPADGSLNFTSNSPVTGQPIPELYGGIYTTPFTKAFATDLGPWTYAIDSNVVGPANLYLISQMTNVQGTNLTQPSFYYNGQPQFQTIYHTVSYYLSLLGLTYEWYDDIVTNGATTTNVAPIAHGLNPTPYDFGHGPYPSQAFPFTLPQLPRGPIPISPGDAGRTFTQYNNVGGSATIGSFTVPKFINSFIIGPSSFQTAAIQIPITITAPFILDPTQPPYTQLVNGVSTMLYTLLNEDGSDPTWEITHGVPLGPNLVGMYGTITASTLSFTYYTTSQNVVYYTLTATNGAFTNLLSNIATLPTSGTSGDPTTYGQNTYILTSTGGIFQIKWNLTTSLPGAANSGTPDALNHSQQLYLLTQSIVCAVIQAPSSYVNSTSWHIRQASSIAGFNLDSGAGTVSVLTCCPAAVTTYQQRLIFGGTYNFPQTLWLSASGVFNHFLPAANASDPIEVDLVSDKPCIVRWIAALRKLIVGTSLNEIELSDPAVGLTPAGITAVTRSAIGSTIQVTTQVEQDLLYIHRSTNKLFMMQYQFFIDGYLSNDISLSAEHLFGENIVEVAFRLHPFYTIYAVTVTGDLLTAVYSSNLKLNGWSVWKTTGSYERVSICHRSNYDQVYVVVNRNGTRYVEIFDESINPYYVDNYTLYSGSSTNTITGLSQYNGQSVAVYGTNIQSGTNAFVGNYQVTNGQITLSQNVTNAVIGLPYTMTAVTLQPETGQGMQTTTLPSTNGRWNRVFLSVYSSGVPTVNGVAPNVRTTSMQLTEPVPLQTGYLTYEGVSGTPTLTIQSSDNVPINVTGISGEYEIL